MTDKLKQLLHERTDAVDFAMPDVDALTRAGDRRLRTPPLGHRGRLRRGRGGRRRARTEPDRRPACGGSGVRPADATATP